MSEASTLSAILQDSGRMRPPVPALAWLEAITADAIAKNNIIQFPRKQRATASDTQRATARASDTFDIPPAS